ncbi:MAG: response regulator [Desulfobacterales bacterium]|nr:response regulator [Desulfobacterales bacterium]
MLNLKRIYKKLTAPQSLSPTDDIQYWKEKVLLTLLLFGIFVGLAIWLPSAIVLTLNGHWIQAVFNTLAFGALIYLFARQDLSYGFRAFGTAFIPYAIGVEVILSFGPYGVGLIYLFFFPLVVSLLLELRYTIMALCLNLSSFVGFGILMYLEVNGLISGFHFGSWHLANGESIYRWGIISVSFMLLSIQSVILITVILSGLHKSLTQLKASEQKYRHVFENIMDIYFETDLKGHFLTLSPSIQAFCGYTANELIIRDTTIFHRQSRNRKNFLSELMANGRILNHDIVILDRDGNEKAASINARLVYDSQGKPIRVTGICRDVTETRQMMEKKQELEEQLTRSQKMEALGMLAGGVAHDLNNVLSGIVTYPELLLMELPKGSSMAKSMELVHAAGLRATEIVQDLLTLSRRGVTRREPVDLNTLVEQFLDTPECKKILSYHPGVEVVTELMARPPALIEGSLIHLQKTIMNLISNAAEAQPTGGRILISTSNQFLKDPIKGYDQVQPGQYVVLGVEDAGCGIAPEDIKRIFEPFFTKKVMGRSGTGLGMAVVWGTVQDHYGYIDVNSDAEQGTRFDIYFPASQEEKTIQEIKPTAPLPRGNGETILVVDDMESQRRITTNALVQLGYRVKSFGNGESAIRFLKKSHADLLVLDMIMEPGIDGLETFQRVLAFKPDQKAIIVSGFSKTGKVEQAMAMGAGCYLKKPYTLDEIGMAVSQNLPRPSRDDPEIRAPQQSHGSRPKAQTSEPIPPTA